MIGLRVRAKPAAPSSTPRQPKPTAVRDHTGILAERRLAASTETTGRDLGARAPTAGPAGAKARPSTTVGRPAASAARASSDSTASGGEGAAPAFASAGVATWRPALGDDTAWLGRTTTRPTAGCGGDAAAGARDTVAATRIPDTGATSTGATASAGTGSSAGAEPAAGATGTGCGGVSTTCTAVVTAGCGAGTGATGGAGAGAGAAGVLTGR